MQPSHNWRYNSASGLRSKTDFHNRLTHRIQDRPASNRPGKLADRQLFELKVGRRQHTTAVRITPGYRQVCNSCGPNPSRSQSPRSANSGPYESVFRPKSNRIESGQRKEEAVGA